MRRYVMSSRILARLKTLGLDVRCQRCLREIEAGDQVVSIQHSKHGTTKFYHDDCFRETLIGTKRKVLPTRGG